MPKADSRLNTSRPPSHLFGDLPPLGNISVPDGLFLPGIDTSDVYALRLVGRALEPIASSGEHAIVSPSRPYEPSDFVVLVFTDEDRGALIRRLVVPSPMPFGAPSAGSNVVGSITVELLNEKLLQDFRTDQLAAVHRVIGFLKHDGSMAELPQPERARRAS